MFKAHIRRCIRQAALLAVVAASVPRADAADSSSPQETTAHLAGLKSKADVWFDDHGVPHIFAHSWADAARALGYVHASDRLAQMDFFRRRGSGTLAEIAGKDALDDDILVRRLGIRRSCQAYWASDQVPAEMRQGMEAYSEGVNQRIAELKKSGLPFLFTALHYAPAPWTPIDSLVFSKYMGWDQSGTQDDLWFGIVAEKLGVETFEQLWPLDRPYEIPTIAAQSDRTKITLYEPRGSSGTSLKRERRNASSAPSLALQAFGEGAADAYASILRNQRWTRWLGTGGAFGSNNWAVDGTKTVSGKPILCNDPHLDLRLPSIWYACHLSVDGKSQAGVTFPGGPAILIGCTEHHAWGLTNMEVDAVDYFVETVRPDHPRSYRHRGEWKEMERIVEQIPVRGQAAYELVTDYTVHGPVISRDKRTVSLQWTGLGPTRDPEAIWRMGRAKSLNEFLEGLDLLEVPPLNVCYADVEGNIAMHPCGRLPLRLPGQGRIPMEGASGINDWHGWVPRRELPLEINPARHFVASANNRPTPAGYPHYLGWAWDCSYRIRRIHDMLNAAKDLSVATMAALQTDAHDKAAERFVPVLLSALGKAPNAQGSDALTNQAIDALAKWDYVARPEAIAPAIWLRWFELYRDAVWKDKLAARGVPAREGFWGFSDTNRREPELEVLEYLTREQPHSPWFDDPATTRREDRDIIMRRSFQKAIDSLRRQFGPNLDDWKWKNINRLNLPSLAGIALLGRQGGPVPGTPFTVNPGGNVGKVQEGASWRMIVDLADVSKSVGVYPGGQSESPGSPLYSDQMRFWEKGRYLPLNVVGNADGLPQAAKTRHVVFIPSPSR